MDVDKILAQRRAFQRAKFHGSPGDPDYPHEGGGGGGDQPGGTGYGGPGDRDDMDPTTKTGRHPGKNGGDGSYDQGYMPGDTVKVTSRIPGISDKVVRVIELSPSGKFLIVQVGMRGPTYSVQESDVDFKKRGML